MGRTLRSICLVSIGACSLVLAACQQVEIYQRKAIFVEEEYAPYRGPGDCSISGQAFMKTRGGDVKFGAACTISLNPVTSYSTEWFEAGILNGKTLSPPDPRTEEFYRESIGDGEGRFVFENLQPGEYFIATAIYWDTGHYGWTGGIVHAHVALAPGEHKANVVVIR